MQWFLTRMSQTGYELVLWTKLPSQVVRSFRFFASFPVGQFFFQAQYLVKTMEAELDFKNLESFPGFPFTPDPPHSMSPEEYRTYVWEQAKKESPSLAEIGRKKFFELRDDPSSYEHLMAGEASVASNPAAVEVKQEVPEGPDVQVQIESAVSRLFALSVGNYQFEGQEQQYNYLLQFAGSTWNSFKTALVALKKQHLVSDPYAFLNFLQRELELPQIDPESSEALQQQFFMSMASEFDSQAAYEEAFTDFLQGLRVREFWRLKFGSDVMETLEQSHAQLTAAGFALSVEEYLGQAEERLELINSLGDERTHALLQAFRQHVLGDLAPSLTEACSLV